MTGLREMVKRNGFDSVRARRTSQAGPPSDHRAKRKFVIERAVGRYIANPAVRALRRFGISTTLATDLETTGRRTGLPRQTPVSAAFDDTGAWLISQHGTRSGWASNITGNPRIRLRHGNRWRTGTAELHPNDDVDARARTFASCRLFAGLTAAGFRTLQSTPISVRVTFTEVENQFPPAR